MKKLLLMFFMFSFFSARAKADQPIAVDLSKHLVAISAGFTGTEVLLFGATDGPGDVIMVVRGPATDRVIRKKKKISGIWINRESFGFRGVPGFYRVASSKPVKELLEKRDLQRLQIGSDNIYLTPDGEIKEKKREEYRKAILRLQKDNSSYKDSDENIIMMENRLFRTELFFPADVPLGTYMVEVYLVRDKKIVSAEITPLIVSKTGIGAEIYFFAHKHSFLYGILAVLIAAFAGWCVSVVFRKR